MYNDSLVITVSSLLLGVMLSGCIGFGIEEDCKLPTTDDPEAGNRSVLGELRGKWRHTWEDPDGTVLFDVIALRTSPPDAPYDPPEHEPQPSTTKYVDWHSIRPGSYSEVLHDFLCVAQWLGENITKKSVFGTSGSVGVSLYNETMDKLQYEFDRQNKQEVEDGWCCYVLFEGDFYATTTKEAIGTPVS